MSDRSRIRLAAYALAVALLALAGLQTILGGQRDGEPSGKRAAVALDAAGHGHRRGPGSRPGPDGPWVHVAGAIRRPGLYHLDPGSRVAAALARAGGPSRRADLSAVNLAAPLEDGQQVLVPTRPPGAAVAAAAPARPAIAGPQPSGGGSSTATAGPPLSLSRASVEQLDTLDGIGPTLAGRIVEYGRAHGGFRSLNELQQIEGIGPKRLESLREAVRP